MRPAYDPGTVVLPSEEAARAIEPSLIFRWPTIRIVHVTVLVAGLGLLFWSSFQRTALLTPIDPTFHALMIGLGVFAGVLIAEVEREAWLLGIGVSRWRPAPRGLYAAFAMTVLVGLFGIAGHFTAGLLVEWRAFHGLTPPAGSRMFTVTGLNNSRNGASLDLQDSRSGYQFSISCGQAMLGTVHRGERLMLPVQTGRGGVQRVTLPAPRDVRQADAFSG